jgi:hypothetical protein
VNWFIRWLHKSEAKRIDRERMYLWVHTGLPFVGLGIALRPEMVGLPTISPDANRLLGLLIVWGSGLCLISACMGMSGFMQVTKLDVRIPYGSGAFGQLSVVTSLSYYIWQIARISPWIHVMGLGLTFCIAFACLHITGVAIKEIWRVQHLRTHKDCPNWPRHEPV